jgi:NAD(P)-dependent dehydrogenase (short-subunit alcohol dehydrogenase family)
MLDSRVQMNVGHMRGDRMATYPELNGKVALISGAGGNLGLSVVTRLHAEGLGLALIDRDEASLRTRLKANGIDDAHVLIGAVDLLQKAQVDDFVGRVTTHFGQIDALLNLAGGYKPQPPIHEMEEATWDFLMNINAKTTFLLSGAVARHMVARGAGGRIVSVAARSALKGDAGNAGHAASKAAVVRLTESMAAELLEHHITVNAVLPSVLDTPPNRAGNPDADYSRWVSPDSLADVLTFLLSNAARDITGGAIPVYGKS